jgi:hypothetical protein
LALFLVFGKGLSLGKEFWQEVLDSRRGRNVIIEQIFPSLKVIFGLFVLNSKHLDYNNGLV